MNENTIEKIELVPEAESAPVQRLEKFELFWMDPTTGKKYPGGVAFYLDRFGEYHLKLDAITDGRPLYLKPVNAINDRVNYRVEVAVKRRDGSFSHRTEIGSGYCDSNSDGMVIMDIGPFCRRLVLTLKNRA